MKDKELDRILDQYDTDDLRLVYLDGFKIYEKETGEKLWGWDYRYDGAPTGALEILFSRVGLECEE